VEVWLYPFLTSAVGEGEVGQLHSLAALPRVSTEQEAWWAPQLVWTFE